MIGLSLSYCIKDVLDGTVSVEHIDKIVAGTKIVTEEDLDYTMALYRQTYWSKDPERGERIARNLFALGLIEQPCVAGGDLPNLSQGWWRPS